ncbi:phosphoglycolate phosphatase [Phaeovulum sp. W22_SRMD_FR3]|uniref:phosphoglycolate phosphatase n=1 Tax=Phaeovulum sp. W22_SRMD_FR3 TaxID=3240274 RepID=UPI003F974759
MRPPVPLIFDLDGTLIDSAPDLHATANAVLAAEGLPGVTLPQLRSYIGNGVRHLVDCLLKADNRPVSGPLQARVLAAYMARYEAAVTLTYPYPGVRAALEGFRRAGHRMAICTNKPMAATMSVLKHLKMNEYFDVVIAGDSLELRKPDPAPLLLARARLGGDEALYIGDSEVDAATAAAARMRFLVYTEGYRKGPVDAMPHVAAFDDFAALPGIVAQIRADVP